MITNGVSASFRNWVDAAGNLYVTSAGNTYVVEFAPGGSSRKLIYNAGMEEPFDVATDSHGNVYEARPAARGRQRISATQEYRNRNLRPLRRIAGRIGCRRRARRRLSWLSRTEALRHGHVIVFSSDLSGCHSALLGASLGVIGGIVFDKHSNLVVCDLSGSVDVLKPPYKNISRNLGAGYVQPFSVRVDKRYDQAYVADTEQHEIFVVRYPSGKLLKALGSNKGVSDPTGAVDSENLAP